jgi:large subunit ribosomal protein L25
MEVAQITATVRQETGSKANARLRREGRVPGVMYGLSGSNERFTLDILDLQSHLRHHHRVYKVKLGKDEQAAYLQDVQYDCLTDEPLHVDFKRIDLTKPMDLVVEVQFVGHPVGIGKGGVLIRDHSEIQISALPTAIPENVPVKVDHLDIGGKIFAKELKLPAGVTLRVSPEMVICHVVEAKVEEVAAPAAATPAEGAATAAPGAPAAGAAPAAPAKAEEKKEDKKDDKKK